MLQHLSILLRQIKSKRKQAKELEQFGQLKAQLLNQFSAVVNSRGSVLIKLDDIGDYLLFRNFLPSYFYNMEPSAPKYFVGNSAWRQIFETLDILPFDEVLWIDKPRYFQEEKYRWEVWQKIFSWKCSTAIAPSVSRTFLLDDCCILAAVAPISIGAKQQYGNDELRKMSDENYTSLVTAPSNEYEFLANQSIATTINKLFEQRKKPELPMSKLHVDLSNYVCCFIGANAISRRWTANGWIELIQKLIDKDANRKIILLGGSKDKDLADKIVSAVGSETLLSQVGSCSLLDSMSLIVHAELLVSNNSMAYHVSMSAGVPTVLLTNGENPYRFTHFNPSVFPKVKVVYPPRFEKVRDKFEQMLTYKFVPVKKDIQSISVGEVWKVVVTLLHEIK